MSFSSYLRPRMLRGLMLGLVAACMVAAPTASAAPAASKKASGVTCVLHAKLAAEIDTGSTSTAKGHTQIKVSEDGTIEFKTKIKNDGETFVAAHIHQGAVGVDGPPVELLFGGPQTSARHIKQTGDATPLADTTGADLCADPAGYYVNYHTTEFPAGAIRGQLH
jgi:Cu/Zn superoxide dismutase